jgi:hypothetical protein
VKSLRLELKKQPVPWRYITRLQKGVIPTENALVTIVTWNPVLLLQKCSFDRDQRSAKTQEQPETPRAT